MTFSLHQGGLVMSNQITHTQSSNIHPLALTLDTCALIFIKLRPFYSLSQPPHVTASTPLQVITTSARKGGPKEHRAKHKWPRETYSVTCPPGPSTLSYLSHSLHRYSSVAKLRPPSHHPSSLNSVYLVPDLHLLPPSTPFWPNGTYPFFPFAQTISILSDLLYSITPFLFHLPYAPLPS